MCVRCTQAEALYNDLEGWHATEEVSARCDGCSATSVQAIRQLSCDHMQGLLKKDIGDYFDSPDDWEIWSLYDVLDETLEGHVTMEVYDRLSA